MPVVHSRIPIGDITMIGAIIMAFSIIKLPVYKLARLTRGLFPRNEFEGGVLIERGLKGEGGGLINWRLLRPIQKKDDISIDRS